MLMMRPQRSRNMGDIIIDNGEKKETAKGLTEEELTGALVRVSKSGARMACFVNGSGEHTLADTGREGYSAIKDALEKTRALHAAVLAEQYAEWWLSNGTSSLVPQTCNSIGRAIVSTTNDHTGGFGSTFCPGTADWTSPSRCPASRRGRR